MHFSPQNAWLVAVFNRKYKNNLNLNCGIFWIRVLFIKPYFDHKHSIMNWMQLNNIYVCSKTYGRFFFYHVLANRDN